MWVYYIEVALSDTLVLFTFEGVSMFDSLMEGVHYKSTATPPFPQPVTLFTPYLSPTGTDMDNSPIYSKYRRVGDIGIIE